jgi:plasmid replication initiation protein
MGNSNDNDNRNSLVNEKLADPILRKHVGLIHCENKLTLIQRKICNVLLFNALDTINVKDTHEISFKHLCSLVGYNSNDINLIKRSLKTLISVVMEWNLLDDSKFISEQTSEEAIAWHASSLLAGASITKGVIRYSYSPQIKTVLSSLEIYGRINLFVQSKFNSSYSLVLYENCVRFKNIKQTSWLDLQLFRSLMGIANDKYPSFKELKRNILNVAINEINQKSDIVIESEYKKAGRQITAIKFLIRENENYRPAFKKLNKPKEIKLTDQSTMLDILMREFAITKNRAEEMISNYSNEYLLEKINLVKKKSNVDNPGAYLVSALKNDYKINQNKVQIEEIERNHMRELKQAFEIGSLRKKYMEYKSNLYLNYFAKQPAELQATIREKFEHHLKSNNPLLNTFKKKEFKSPFVMAEFINYIDQHFPYIIKECLNFDNYLTAEETELFI